MDTLASVKSVYGWIPRKRNYDEEIASSQVVGVETDERPLQEAEAKENNTKEPEPETTIVTPLSAVADPLSNYDPLRDDNPLAETHEAVYDPLSLAVMEEEISPGIHKARAQGENFMPWSAKKPAILKKYTTNERVSITVSFMENEQAGPVDKVKDRLEELEEQEKQEENVVKVSQQEYISQIETLHKNLLDAWNANQRVQALKIAIQCSKFLSDVSVIKFYPSKFVLVTEILDTFGRLVFDRLKGRSTVYSSIDAVPVPLPEDFKAEDVTPIARETCRNWFFKIASIRELLPRLFVEMALINCYRFLANDTFASIVSRIGEMLKGIGDPLVATYARAYLARKGQEVGCYRQEYQLSMFFAHIDTYIGLHNEKHGDISRFTEIVRNSGLEEAEYVDLYTPALEWLLQCLGHNATQELLDVIVKKYREANNPFILDHILSSFQPSFISPRSLDFSDLIKNADETLYPKYKLYKTLGKCLVEHAPPPNMRKQILNDIWSVVTGLTDPAEYMSIVEVFIEFPAKHCTLNELNIMLGDVLKHVNKDHIYENFQNELVNICETVLRYQDNFTKIFSMENFMPIVDLLSGSVQVKINRAILECFCRDNKPTTDPVLINVIFEVGKIVHDSINSLSFEDEIRQIANLISIFIKKINYGMDLEKQLNFYVECRRAFGNLDAVKQSLVLVSAGLAMKTHQVIKGNHSKRTAAFVRACIAFCFITIPAMDNVFPRLYLYLLAGQAALVNQCIPQSEALFEAAISLVAEVPEYEDNNKQVVSTGEQLLNYISSLASELIVVPGHPEQGPFFLLKNLLQIFEERNWEANTITRSQINLKIIAHLCALVQPSLPYHIPKIESNDYLYSGDPVYHQEVQDIIDSLIKLTVQNIEQLASSNDASALRLRSKLAFDLFHYTIVYATLDEQSCALALKMFNVAKSTNSNVAALKNTVQYLSTLPFDPEKSEVNYAEQLQAQLKV